MRGAGKNSENFMYYFSAYSCILSCALPCISFSDSGIGSYNLLSYELSPLSIKALIPLFVVDFLCLGFPHNPMFGSQFGYFVFVSVFHL